MRMLLATWYPWVFIGLLVVALLVWVVISVARNSRNSRNDREE